MNTLTNMGVPLDSLFLTAVACFPSYNSRYCLPSCLLAMALLGKPACLRIKCEERVKKYFYVRSTEVNVSKLLLNVCISVYPVFLVHSLLNSVLMQ